MPNQPLELISFKICPFVQRSVIALNEKQVDYKVTHIDPSEPPDWFKDISPTGKVPVLKVGEQPVFESAVILEYLDEVYAPQLHPQDPLQKAIHRSWIAFCTDLVMIQFKMTTVKEEAGFEENREALKQGLQRLASAVAEQGPYFAGETFHLVDTVYAPLFMRLNIVESSICPLELEMPERLQSWSAALLQRESVKNSVVEDFETLFKGFLKKQDGYLLAGQA